jgi:hypothetical protein
MNDRYKRLRNEVVPALRTGDLQHLESLPPRVTASKRNDYAACVNGLRLFLKKHEVKFLADIAPSDWTCGELEVRVNPEVRLQVDGVAYLVKLFMVQQPLLVVSEQALGYLITEAHCSSWSDSPALLDLRRSKLVLPRRPTTRTPKLVRVEAASFVAMWYASLAA